MTHRTLAALSALALTGALVGCSENEAPPTEDHIPVRYEVQINGQTVTAPFTFVSGQTVRVQLKFFNAVDEDLDVVESGHFGGLTFNPTPLATAARLTGHNYQFDVTGETAGTGTLQVGFGHNEMADEHTFPPAAVTVTGP